MRIWTLFYTAKFFFVVRAEVFHGSPERTSVRAGIPEKNAERSAQVGISQYGFLSKLYFISQHRCIACRLSASRCYT